MTSTTPNTPANGGKILTDERIKELADQINWANVEWDYEAQLKFARAIEADLLAALAAPASVPQPAVQSIDTEEFRKLCDAYHCASQSALEDAYYAIVYHVDEEVSDLAHSWRLVVAQPAAQVAVSEDEQLALMVKVEDYMGAVDWAGTQIHAKCDAAEAAIFSKVNEIILCRAVPAPVSGMPDLALDVPNDALRTALAFMGFIDSDVQALAAKFALPVQTMAEILQHVNVLPALQAPDAPVAPAEVYQWRRRIEGQPWFDGSKKMAYQRVDENYEARMLYAAPAVAAPLPAAPAPTEQAGMVERMCRDFPALQAFHEKYALGPMLAPSCLCCGQQTHAMTRPVAIKHGELPGIVICAECRDGAALAARQAPTEDEFAKMMSDANVTHIACMMGNMIYNLSQKKGHMLTAADCEMFNNLREQWDAARQVPDQE